MSDPRFMDGALEKNLVLLKEVESVAEEAGATLSQVALAWLLTKREDWSPIPGTIRVPHLEEDLLAVDVKLTPEQIFTLDNVGQPMDDHHTAPQMELFDRAR